MAASQPHVPIVIHNPDETSKFLSVLWLIYLKNGFYLLLKYEEGCLSVPDVFEEVERPVECRIRYLDYDGNEVEEVATGLFAVCIQHEMDHLEGTLFIDHLSRLKRQRAVDKVKKAKRLAEKSLA